jgi:MoaA/NifB/PqqE/SkfB family radical SAM enzyme
MLTKNAKGKKYLEEYIRRSAFPTQVLIESTSFCNLRCAMCARNFNPRKFGVMDEALARKVIDEIAREAPDTRIWFCYFGEPLIMKNKGLFERIKYATDKGITRTVINTNGNLMDEACVDKMIWSGLKEVYVGVDAITPETYEKLRIRGNYGTLMKNIDIFLKKAADRIQLTVQFAVLDENEHELAEFERYWKSRAVKVFIRPKMTWINYISDKVKNKGPRQPCPWIFDSLNINEDGRVPYCIMDWQNTVP